MVSHPISFLRAVPLVVPLHVCSCLSPLSHPTSAVHHHSALLLLAAAIRCGLLGAPRRALLIPELVLDVSQLLKQRALLRRERAGDDYLEMHVLVATAARICGLDAPAGHDAPITCAG